ncbi:hypothetical protein TrVE_jg8711 [Triparma verrucosa]|uniref:Uncharacterized protein n=1 Tax=Triparma verrucosa TaxID=1606542 RepID=A0A9W7B4E4_9STRA|nr:hypothetical protein TrVE_jg8711 [Triparma verrucosa]
MKGLDAERYADPTNKRSRASINHPNNAPLKDQIQQTVRRSKAKAITIAESLPPITTPLATLLSSRRNTSLLLQVINEQRPDLIHIIAAPLNKTCFTDTGILPEGDHRVYNTGLLLPSDDSGAFRYYNVFIRYTEKKPTEYHITSWTQDRTSCPLEIYNEAEGQEAVCKIIGERTIVEWSNLRKKDALDYKRIEATLNRGRKKPLRYLRNINFGPFLFWSSSPSVKALFGPRGLVQPTGNGSIQTLHNVMWRVNNTTSRTLPLYPNLRLWGENHKDFRPNPDPSDAVEDCRRVANLFALVRHYT